VFSFVKRGAKRNWVSGREDVALVYKTTGNYTAGDRRSLSGPTLVAVVKPSDLGNYYDAPAFWLLYYSRLRSVLGQRQMSSGAPVVGKITSQSSAQRSFIPHDDVV
jgi:hypothetical protein